MATSHIKDTLGFALLVEKIANKRAKKMMNLPMALVVSLAEGMDLWLSPTIYTTPSCIAL
jgi:hypothetical protein